MAVQVSRTILTSHDRERELTNQHYDQIPRLFELFLDRSLKYSSGWFEQGTEALDEAQQSKLHLVSEQLALQPGRSLLDIGCGWGALVLHAAQAGCNVVGITPSARQRGYVLTRAAELGMTDRVNVLLGSFDAMPLPRASFDAVAMMGSATHLRNKSGAVRQARNALRKGGRLYLSESAFRSERVYRHFDQRPGTEFVRNNIFGWGELIPFSDYVRFFEDAGLSLVTLFDLTEHYRQTIVHWRTNVLQNRRSIDALGGTTADDLLRFFDVCNAAWGLSTKHYALIGERSR